MQPSREVCPIPKKITATGCTVTVFKKPFCCSRMLGNMVRPVNSMDMGPCLYFICCEVSFLTRSHVV